MPSLHSKFIETNITCNIFLFEWVIAMYSNILDIKACSRIWDNILFHGEYYIIKVALAICSCISDKCQNMLDFGEVVMVIKNFPEHLDEEELFDSIKKLDLTKVEYFKTKMNVKSEMTFSFL